MANTTNFGWETPDDTDLVKDGAAAIRTLGSAIDTSLVDLKGGTTGQVLSKTSGTDMDFTWVAQDDSNAIQNAIVDAKGDIVAASAADTPARLAVGTNETRLVADSAQATGLKYVADTTNYAIGAKGDLLVGTAADTLQALAVGTNGYTLVADSSTSTGLAWSAPASGGGKVLQVVSTAKTDAFSTATAAFTDVTGLSVTITPTASTSKILVLVTLNASARDGQGNSGARIVRGSTDIFIGDTASNRVRVTTDISRNDIYAAKNFGLTYLDSPATTSATTYKVQVSGLPSSSGWTTYVNRSYDDTDSSSFGRSASSITVMEIGA